MRYKRAISVLVVCIALLSAVTSVVGVFSNAGPGSYEFESLRSGTVTIYGKGLYQYEVARFGPQARGQDAVTLVIGIPLLLISLRLALKGSIKGRMMLAGVLSYFLYTFTQYTALPYNQFFLVYIALMAASLYAFILTMMSFDLGTLGGYFNDRLPVKFIGGFQILIALTLSALWLSDLIPALINDTVPRTLYHYSSNPIYSMDLGLVVPTCILSAILIFKRRPFGYLLSSIMIFKGFTMLTALTFMGIALVLEGGTASIEMVIFPVFNVIAIFAAYFLLKNINDTGQSKVSASHSA